MAAGFHRAKNMLILRRNTLLNNLTRNLPEIKCGSQKNILRRNVSSSSLATPHRIVVDITGNAKHIAIAFNATY
ncbi:hypothetical protein JMM30_005312 [Escherichia coli]|nr:hypothetical protein [Escherichia coli]EHK3320771.1 hypothetical protein [Escherichia coli]